MTPEQHAPAYRWARKVYRKWPWYGEVFLLMISVVALMAMVGLLKGYQGQSVFRWHGVTLNAAIAVISVLFKASLTSALATCLGQWKWIMLSRQEAPLLDFERIDNASRGPWGSIFLIPRGTVS